MKSTEEEIRDARNAAAVLENPLFKEAFEKLEKYTIDSMKLVPMHDIDTQHELVLTLQLLAKFRRNFETIVETGKMAEAKKESLSQQVKRYIRK